MGVLYFQSSAKAELYLNLKMLSHDSYWFSHIICKTSSRLKHSITIEI